MRAERQGEGEDRTVRRKVERAFAISSGPAKCLLPCEMPRVDSRNTCQKLSRRQGKRSVSTCREIGGRLTPARDLDFFLLVAFVSLSLLIHLRSLRIMSPQPSEVDVLIVGAGPAGCESSLSSPHSASALLSASVSV